VVGPARKGSIPRPASNGPPFQRVARAYFATLVVLALTIGLEHLLVPAEIRMRLVSALAGSEYARVQLPAFAALSWLLTVHSGSGMAIVVLAPVQLWSRFRKRHRTAHRILGAIFVGAAAISALTGVAVARSLEFSGPSEPVPNVVVAVLIIAFMGCGVRSALRGERAAHREWMLRAVALGLGIGLARVYLFGLVQLVGLSSREALGQALWLGSGTNLVLTEVWINISRRAPLKAGSFATNPEPRAFAERAREVAGGR